MSSLRRRSSLPFPFPRSRRSATIAAAAAIVLAVSGAAGSAAAFAPPSAGSAVSTGTGLGLAPLPGGLSKPATDFTAGRYIVTMTNPAVSTYSGGIGSFAATKPAEGDQMNARSAPVTSYSNFLATRQREVADSAGVSIGYSYTLALNAFSANLTPEQASALTSSRDVAQVTPDEIKHITAAEPSTTYLGLDGATGVWAQNGGVSEAGKGIVIGDLDTGIAPENPSFAGAALGTTAGDAPYLTSEVDPEHPDTTIRFDKADGGTFYGACVTGQQFTASDCSTKIVGARYFVDGFGADNIGTVATGEYVSPRDGDGHGSHTASTAGGNNATDATIGGDSFGNISGVAPAAKIAAYKVCWSGPDPVATDDDGCSTADMLAAIDQAVLDGVDVLNFSIGGSSAQTTVSLTDQAFLGAASAGIFVSASAGNSGPGASTLDNASPWYTTVAASTIPSYEATATLGDGTKFAGGSITVQTGDKPALEGDLVRADLVKLASASVADALLCAPDSLDPAKVDGKIVFCQRGVYDRTAKSAEVKRAGGIGMLLVNKTPSSIDLDEHSVPTVHLDAAAWDATYAYAAEPGATVTFSKGNTAGPSPAVPVLAGFSSHGPVEADGSDILKPDVSAPGVAILAAGANAAGEDPTWEFLSGTSMAAPHVTGLAALYLGIHPNASVSEIKSALMTTATDTVDNTGAPVEDVFGQGAGNVVPTKYLDAGLLYLNDVPDWLAYIQGIGYDVGVNPIDASDLNLASIAIGSLTGTQTVTRTVTATAAGSFTVAPVSIPGIDTVVTPSTLDFSAAGESKSYTVQFTRTDAPLNEYTTGYMTWSNGDIEVRSPIALQPVPIAAPFEVDGTGTTGSVDISVIPGSGGDIPLTVEGLAKGNLLTADNQDPSIPLDGHSAVTPLKETAEFAVTIPEGVSEARFDLTSIATAEEGADLDLFVDQLDADGEVVATYTSATGAADERIDILAPEAGNYAVRADVFALPAGQANGAMDLKAYYVEPATGEGDFTAPATIAGTQGEPVSFTASWAGLDYSSSYLGLVSYRDSGVSTFVGVTTEAAPTPTPTGSPTPTATAVPPVPTPTPTTPGSSSSPTPPPGDGSGTPGDSLASTGLSTILPLGLAGILLLAGIAALIVRRQRKLGHANSSDE
ncbi:S8 family peptidase [Subtercola boreus]|uniref:S8 family peptidase n=1 Tax=Subtercola boreus TaxID=120213 RepID=UPI00209C2FA7|nr:S8 family peptidase [Subtercola boreus]